MFHTPLGDLGPKRVRLRALTASLCSLTLCFIGSATVLTVLSLAHSHTTPTHAAQAHGNKKSAAIKRIFADLRELNDDPSDQYYAMPREDNIFDWHFTIRGPTETAFEGGIYHGRIILPLDYPMKPPNIMLLTPNGRFVVRQKICLSISAYHPESWNPAWGVRTMLEAIISFMPSKGEGAIGSLDYTPDERKRLAAQSHAYECPDCGLVKEVLEENTPELGSVVAREAGGDGGGEGVNKYAEQAKALHMHAATGPTLVRNASEMAKEEAAARKEDDEGPMAVPVPAASGAGGGEARGGEGKREEKQHGVGDDEVRRQPVVQPTADGAAAVSELRQRAGRPAGGGGGGGEEKMPERAAAAAATPAPPHNTQPAVAAVAAAAPARAPVRAVAPAAPAAPAAASGPSKTDRALVAIAWVLFFAITALLFRKLLR